MKAEIITPKKLSELAGLSVRWLSDLAAAGVLVKVPGGYGAGSVARIVKHYRELANRARLDPLQEVRKAILEDRLKLSRGQLVEVDRVRREATETFQQVRSRLRNIPSELAVKCGLGSAEEQHVSIAIDDTLRELATAVERKGHVTKTKS